MLQVATVRLSLGQRVSRLTGNATYTNLGFLPKGWRHELWWIMLPKACNSKFLWKMISKLYIGCLFCNQKLLL